MCALIQFFKFWFILDNCRFSYFIFFFSGVSTSSSAETMNTIIKIDFSEEDPPTGTLLPQQESECPHCHMTFARPSYLVDHMRIHTTERRYICQICQRGFTQSGNLQRHLRMHEGIRPYQCTVCDYRATQSSDLKKHIIRKHRK